MMPCSALSVNLLGVTRLSAYVLVWMVMGVIYEGSVNMNNSIIV